MAVAAGLGVAFGIAEPTATGAGRATVFIIITGTSVCTAGTAAGEATLFVAFARLGAALVVVVSGHGISFSRNEAGR